jgi:uncharacterized protein (TIGR02996 family)
VEAAFLAALHADPNDEATWLALADWLEEDGQTERAELVRLVRRLRALPVMEVTPERAALEDRVAGLLNAGVRPVVPEVVNSIGMRLALIPPGRFLMGSPPDEAGRREDEQQHEVEITKAFYLGVYPVTQGQWRAVMGYNPSFYSTDGKGREGFYYSNEPGGGKGQVAGLNTDDFPVEQVSWEDAQTFLNNLSALEKERQAGRTYRLPTEAEWEYACRGGLGSSPFHFGTSLSPAQASFDESGVRPDRGGHEPGGSGSHPRRAAGGLHHQAERANAPEGHAPHRAFVSVARADRGRTREAARVPLVAR